MARGPKKHLKRLNAPKHWLLHKLGGIWAPRPSSGPHKLRECIPLSLVLRNRLKYSLTRRETTMIVMRRFVEVDGKIRTDINFPAGFMDVINIDKTDERFRLLYDVKGRFVLHRVGKEESGYKLCRVQKISKAKKASIGRNPLQHGQLSTIPYVITHDGRTVRYADPVVKVHDTIKVDIATGKQTGHIKFEAGNTCMVTRGANVGRVGVITRVEKHPGSFDIVHLKDKKNAEFATRMENVFVIGEGQKALISLPRGKGLKQSVIEERDRKAKKIRD